MSFMSKMVSAIGAAQSQYLVSTGFSAVAPNGWEFNVAGGGSINPSSTLQSPIGTHQMSLNPNSANYIFAISPRFNEPEIWAYSRMYLAGSYPANAVVLVAIGNVHLQYNGGIDELKLSNTGAATPASGANTFLPGTFYYVWIHYKAGTGANGVFEVYVSTDETRPASPLLSVTNCTFTVNAQSVVWCARNNTIDPLYVDKVRVSRTEIGSNPP